MQHGIVNAAGDLTTWGTQPNGQPWTIGIADPSATGAASPRQAFSYFAISDMAVATSGTYEKYALINGKRYSHTIDPKTGYPVSGIKSVTIIAPNAELADALATPVMVMGVRVGLDLINQMRHIACIMIDDTDAHSHLSQYPAGHPASRLINQYERTLAHEQTNLPSARYWPLGCSCWELPPAPR